MADPWESAPIVEEAPRAGLAKPGRQPAAAAAPWDSAPVITASSALPNVDPKQAAGLAPRTGAAAVPTADEVRTGTYTPPVAPPPVPERSFKDAAKETVIGAAEAGIELLTQLVSAPIGMTLGPLANMGNGGTVEQNAALGMQQVAQGARSTLQRPMRALGLGVGEGMSPQGAEFTEDIGGAMATLPPVAGVHGTLAGPAGAGASGMGLRRNLQLAAEPATGLVRKVVDTVERVMPKEKAPGAEAPAGSVGAAGVDMPTQRRERAAALGVNLTKGDAERSFEQQRFEKETAKNPELGKPLRERKAEQRRAILDRFDEWVDETGANELEDNALGKGVTDPIYEKALKAKGEVRDKYKLADEAGETAELVNYTPIRAYIEDQTPTTREKLAPILKMAEEQLAKNDPEGTGQLSIKQLNDVRQAIRANTEFGTPNSVQGGELIKLIDAATENAGGDLYKAARKAHAEYAAEFKNQGVIRDLTTLKKGTTDRKVALAQVFDRSVLKATIDDVRAVKRTLTTAGESGVQAWNDLRGKTIEWIKGEATKSAVRDERGNPVISADKLTKAVDRLDKDGRLEELFGKQGAQQLRDVADIAKDVWTSPPDAVNTSNTASVFIGALDTFATYMISGGTVPLPAVTLIKKGLQNLKDRKLKAKVRYALGPGDEVTPSPVRAFEPGKEPPPNIGPGNRGPGNGGGPRGTMPPGGRSDVQVREAEREWQRVFPDLPSSVHARLAQESAVDARATTEGQRAQLRERLSAQGADPAQAVRDVLGPEGADAARGLQPAAAGQMDLPGVPGRALPGGKAPGREATKRERDLVGLREQATDPQVLKDLDLEIAAERRRSADAARAVEYRKLAEATSDPDIKAKFTAKAEKLAPETAKPKAEPAAAEAKPAAAEIATSPQNWKGFVAERMGPYMKSEGGHAGAMKRISEEWKATKNAPEPIPVGEATELDVHDASLDMLKMRAEGEAAWRRTHRVGDLDAERMKTAWQAMEYDAPAVQRAAQQFDNSPRAFDREVQRIIEEGKARATQVNQDPGGSPSVGRPAEAAGRQAGPGPQRPGPDGNAKAGAQRGAPDNEGRPAQGLTQKPTAPPGARSVADLFRDNKGIKREQMPVIPNEAKPEFRAELEQSGVKVQNQKVQADSLKPTQQDFNVENIEFLRGEVLGGKYDGNPIVVSRDGRVLDGHHRWAVAVQHKLPIDVLRVDLPIEQLVDRARAFQERKGIAARSAAEASAKNMGSPRFRELAEKVGKIDEQKGLTPAERGVEKRFADAVRAEPDEFLRRYDELPETRGGKVVNTDEARALWHEYDADKDSRSLNAKAVHEPSSWIAKAKWEQLLAKPPEKGTVLLLGGGGGSGKTSSLGDIAPGFEANFDAIYDTTLANQKKAVSAVQQAIDSGRTVTISYTARAPLDSIVHGIIPRAARQGRTVPLEIAAQAHRDAPAVVKALIERYADDDRVTFQFVDNTRGPGQARLVSPAELPAFDYNQLEGRAFDAAREAYEQGKISKTVLRGLVGEGESQAGQRPREGQGRSAGADDGRQLEPPRGQGSEARQGLTGAPAGYSSTALTERGLEVPFTYRLADVSQLITSHDDTLRLNPAFPQELQPRDRTRMSSEAQITKISNDIKPEFLAESPKASDGAPIVGSDAVVESGNARTIALRRAYANGKADHYRAWLRQNAERFGLKPADIDGLQQPMLVREGLGKYDRAEFARQANESPVSSMAETEVAQADAKKLPDLEGLVTNDDGSINPTQSAEFIRQFMRYVASPNEHNQLMTGDGRLSQRGAARIRNAIFSKAYGDSDIVSLLTEATDGNVRNLLAGMLRAAPDVARVRTLLEAGARAGRDFVPDLVDAVRRFGAAREASQKVEQYLAQGSMFGGEAPPAVADLMRSLEKDSRAPTRIADMIRGLVAEIDKGGDPRQPSMF